MRGLDHAHVIRTVANSQKDRLLILLDEFDDKSFLQGRYTTYQQFDLATGTDRFTKKLTANDSLAHNCQLKEGLRKLLL